MSQLLPSGLGTHIYNISSTQWRVEVCEDNSVFESTCSV